VKEAARFEKCERFCSLSLLEQWRRDYNTQRPHSRLGWLTPSEFADRSRLSKQWPSGAAQPEGSAPMAIASTAQQGNHAVETLPTDGS
jgi:putative transposase